MSYLDVLEKLRPAVPPPFVGILMEAGFRPEFGIVLTNVHLSRHILLGTLFGIIYWFAKGNSID